MSKKAVDKPEYLALEFFAAEAARQYDKAAEAQRKLREIGWELRPVEASKEKQP